MKKTIIVALVLMLAFFSCKKAENVEKVERKFEAEKTLETPGKETAEPQASGPGEEIREEAPSTTVTDKAPADTPKTAVPAKAYATRITAVNQSAEEYSVELDGAVLVKGITFEDGRIVLPYSVSGESKYYFLWANEIKFLNFLGDGIQKKSVAGKGPLPSITEIKIKKYESGALKGWAEVELNGEYWIKSIPIFMSQRGNNIGEPSVKVEGRYVPKVEFINEEWKKLLQEKIFAKFNSAD